MRYGKTLLATAAVALLAAGCGAEAGTGSAAGQAGSAAEFAKLVGQDYHADYDPLASPRAAVDRSDLVVRGTVVNVYEGIAITYPRKAETDRSKGTFVTFEVAVDEVLAGNAKLVVGGRVYVQVPKSQSVDSADLAAANPEPEAVLLLEDITQWKPAKGTKVARPGQMPARAPIVFAFTDGLWLQTPSDDEMVSVAAHPEDLAGAWQQPRTLDDLSEQITAAAG